MSHCNINNYTGVSAYNQMKGLISITDHQKGGAIVCPKPRRIRVLDIILKKEDLEIEQEQCIVSSSPFFCGSPPSRVPNPLVQDARFGKERLAQGLSTLQIRSRSSTVAIKGGCVKMTFGLKPAAVIVEGFDCLNRDGQNNRLSAIA